MAKKPKTPAPWVQELVQALRSAAPEVPGEALWTAGECAAYLKIPEKEVRNRALRRQLPHSKIGRSLRFDPARIRAWVKEQDVPTVEELTR